MYIIPYIRTVSTLNGIQVSVYRILTEGGINLWQESDELIPLLENFVLETNGIYLKRRPVVCNELYICEVDDAKTAIDDFYVWNELSIDDKSTTCWRTFYVFDESNNGTWLPTNPTSEKLSHYNCDDIVRDIYLSHLNRISDI
jgi:hypothetical protein